MFQLLFYKQILNFRLNFGQSSQKRKNILSGMIIGYYNNFSIFNWKYFYFQYFIFFQFFNSWFKGFKRYTRFLRLISGLRFNSIKKGLYFSKVYKKKIQKRLLFIDLRVDFFFLIKDLTYKLNQNFLYLWFPGLFSNFSSQELLIRKNFRHITNFTPRKFFNKLFVLFDTKHLEGLLDELLPIYSRKHVNIISFINSSESLCFKENCLMALPGNTVSITCNFFYCSLFFYLFKGYLFSLQNIYAWLQYFYFSKEDRQIFMTFTPVLFKNNFFRFLFFKDKQFKFKKFKFRFKKQQMDSFKKIFYKLKRFKRKKFYYKAKQTYIKLYKKRKYKGLVNYDAFFFDCKKWYTAAEYIYRKVRHNLWRVVNKQKCFYWHYVIRHLQLNNWFSNYRTLIAFNNQENASFIFTPYPLKLDIFSKYKSKSFLMENAFRVTTYWRKRLRKLWCFYVLQRKLKLIDIHLVLAAYLLKTFNGHFSIPEWWKLDLLNLKIFKGLNSDLLFKGLNLPVKNLRIYFPKMLQSYLSISIKNLKKKKLMRNFLRQKIFDGQRYSFRKKQNFKKSKNFKKYKKFKKLWRNL